MAALRLKALGTTAILRAVTQRLRPRRLSPARLTAVGFLALILLGTGLLMWPAAAVGDHATPFLTALFTATSAVSLTGLVVVDTASYWQPFGQGVILALIQLGGLGIMSLAALSGMLLTGRISLQTRKRTAAEGRPVVHGGIRHTLILTTVVTLICEATVAAIITAHLTLTERLGLAEAVWVGVFHAVSAFNNAGFSTYSDNLAGFTTDAWMLLPIAFALIIGGLGYPVLAEALGGTRRFLVGLATGRVPRARRASMTTTMTLAASGTLLVAGTLFFAMAEWQGLLAGLSTGDRVLNAFFQSASPRTAGFNTVDYSQAHPITLMGTEALMFLGGGSAGTAGGIKVTTACVLVAAVAAEFLGRRDTTIGHRRVPLSVTRQALALAAAGIAVIVLGVAVLRVCDPTFTADQVTFEVVSAFATVGLSTGITAHLSAASHITLCFIMYLGRVGPTTLVAALAARTISLRFSYPEERPFIG